MKSSAGGAAGYQSRRFGHLGSVRHPSTLRPRRQTTPNWRWLTSRNSVPWRNTNTAAGSMTYLPAWRHRAWRCTALTNTTNLWDQAELLFLVTQRHSHNNTSLKDGPGEGQSVSHYERRLWHPPPQTPQPTPPPFQLTFYCQKTDHAASQQPQFSQSPK